MKPTDLPLPRTQASTEITCDRVREQAPAYALGALDPADADDVEHHLLLCQTCDEEFSSLSRITSLLGAGVPLFDPPAAIKQNLLNAVRNPEPQTADTPASLLVPASRNEPAPATASRPPLRRRNWPSGRAIFTPVLVACLLLGVWAMGAQRQLDSKNNDIAQLERENDALAVQLSSIQAGQQAFGSTGIWYPLSNANANAEGAGGIVMGGTANTTTLLSVWNMPQEHNSYHVICESKRGELLAAGELQVNERGTGTVTLTLPSPVSEYRAVHVVPTGSMPNSVADLTNDILQLLLGEPTAIATGES